MKSTRSPADVPRAEAWDARTGDAGMAASSRMIPAGFRAQPALPERRHNHALRARFDSALRLLTRAPRQDEGPDTTLFHVLNRLHHLYPEAPPDELEAVLRAVLRTNQSRSPRPESAGPPNDANRGD